MGMDVRRSVGAVGTGSAKGMEDEGSLDEMGKDARMPLR